MSDSDVNVVAAASVPDPNGADKRVIQRHPLAGLLTALLVAVSVLAAAIIALGVVALVRTAPAAVVVGPSKSVTVTVTSKDSYGVATITTATGSEVIRASAGGGDIVRRAQVRFGESVTATLDLTSLSSSDDGTGVANLACTITSEDGGEYVASRTSVEGSRVQCTWINDGK
jgi:hypothetical protein